MFHFTYYTHTTVLTQHTDHFNIVKKCNKLIKFLELLNTEYFVRIISSEAGYSVHSYKILSNC